MIQWSRGSVRRHRLRYKFGLSWSAGSGAAEIDGGGGDAARARGEVAGVGALCSSSRAGFDVVQNVKNAVGFCLVKQIVDASVIRVRGFVQPTYRTNTSTRSAKVWKIPARTPPSPARPPRREKRGARHRAPTLPQRRPRSPNQPSPNRATSKRGGPKEPAAHLRRKADIACPLPAPAQA